LEVLYRNAELKDAKGISLLTCQLGYSVTAGATAGYLKMILEKSIGQIIVAETENKPVAWVHVNYSASIESGPYCEIIGLVVDEKKRSKGIGKNLVNKAKAWAEQKGVAKLRVRTNVKRTAAHQFYLREGFVETKEQKSLEVKL
jgi:GNAT superfamily N-acetyltransferase